MATLKAQVVKQDYSHWKNVHHTVRQPITRFYDIANPPESAQGSRVEKLRATIRALQGLIREAIRDDLELRAIGSGWSFSKVAATDGIVLNTAYLNWIMPISKASVSSSYPKKHTRLRFAQCGTTIFELNRHLAKKGLSLKASGASNGQTIAGALSTGTHGSAFKAGAIQDFIVGLHLIVGPSRHVWLQPASAPVVRPSFAAKLGAELINDDTLFNAAMVSFGSFGIIHGVLLKAKRMFVLEAERRRLPFNAALRNAITTLTFSGVDLPHPTEEKKLYHFEVQINPHDMKGKVFVRTMYKRKYPHPQMQADDDTNDEAEVEMRPGDDFIAFIGAITDAFPAVTPLLVKQLVKQRLKPFSPKFKILGDMFDYSKSRGKTLGMAMGIPLPFVNQALDTILATHKAHGPYPGVVSMRFVKGSNALLAFTRFTPTCVMELDGLNSALARAFLKRVCTAIDEAEIPYTLHWGKANDHLNATRVRKMYGESLDQWVSSRRRLLRPASRRVFSNAFLKRLDLAT